MWNYLALYLHHTQMTGQKVVETQEGRSPSHIQLQSAWLYSYHQSTCRLYSSPFIFNDLAVTEIIALKVSSQTRDMVSMSSGEMELEEETFPGS